MPLPEAERAAEHQRQLEARCAARCQRLAGLAGNTAARQALGVRWQPLYLALLEAQLPPEPVDEDGNLICVC